MADIDTNIDNYTIDDLISIFDLEHISENTVTYKANELISQYNQPNIRDFFIKAKQKLLAFVHAENNIATNNINTITRTTFINSIFRQHSVSDGPFSRLAAPTPHESIYSETHFTTNLSSKLKNVVQLSLLSAQIPYTWYNIDSAYKNNFFYLNNVRIEVPSGNYTIDTLFATLNNLNIFSGVASITIDDVTKKTFIQSKSGDVNISFFTQGENFKNNSLGWLLGFRDVEYIGNTLTSECVVNINHTQFFFVIVDDFVNNRDNSELISVYNENTALDMPSYFSNDLEITETDGNVPTYGQTVPRIITQAQQYALNEIVRNNTLNSGTVRFPTISNVLAIIPVTTNDAVFGVTSLLYENSDNIARKYFGLADIDKLNIKLVDSLGFLVNLNGSNWSFNLQTIHKV